MCPGPAPIDTARDITALRYTADIFRRDSLHAAYAHATARRARIRHIDVSDALALEGVVAVLTGRDIGGLHTGLCVTDYPVLAVDRVEFAGQRIAVVAATDRETARRAAELIEVEYDPLPPIDDIDAALDPFGPSLHPASPTADAAYPDGNLQGTVTAITGLVDEALHQCDVTYERTFGFHRVHSAPLEPHACIVEPTAEGFAIWSTTKVPNRLRRLVAAAFDLPKSAIKVHPMPVGGDFGSKSMPFIEISCALLARATGRRVQARLSSSEMLTTTTSRHPGRMRIRLGLQHRKLHAYEGEVVLDGGAYAGVKPNPKRVVSLVEKAFRPYGIPVRDERGLVVSTNNLPGGHVRKPGAFQVMFAAESMVDIVARAEGEDPLTFRRRHATDDATTLVLEELAAITTRWSPPDTGRAYGIGVAVFSCGGGRGRTVVRLTATREGVTVELGTPSQGAGMYAVFRRLVAEGLRIPADRVAIVPVGADDVLVDGGAGSSRVTLVAGGACTAACDRLLETLGTPTDSSPDHYWIAERLAERGRTEETVLGEHEVTADDLAEIPDSHAGLAVQVAVDPATGAIDIVQAALVIETGRIIDAVGFRGQVEGGFVYGLSQTLYEHLIFEDGQPVTASLGDYKLACIADVPPLEVRYVRAPGADPTQVRAIGELTNIGVGAAVANAIDDAVGVRLTSMPLSAEAVWRALQLDA